MYFDCFESILYAACDSWPRKVPSFLIGREIGKASCGLANSTTVNEGGDMRIYRGGGATEIVENVGYVYVADGANVTFTSNTINRFALSSGSMTIHSNTVANSTTVNYSGVMRIYSGGVANSTTVNEGGYMYISSGGVANETTINSGGYLYISSGGVANETTINSGEGREEFLLRPYDGEQPLIRRRVGTGDDHIDRPCIGMLLMLQTDFLKKIGTSVSFFDSGLASRCLFCYPESWVGKTGTGKA